MGKEYRVFGPPGTGKTTFLTKQVKNAVKKHGSESVIVASFTNASAKEIGSRELPLDDRQVGTLHSHCYRALDYPEVAEGNIKDFNKFAPQYKLSTKEKKDIDNPNLVDNTESKADQLFLKYQNLRARMIEKKLWPTSISNFAEKWE